MNAKIHRRNCKFIVKPEERMVLCIIEGDYVEHMLLDYLEQNDSSVEFYISNFDLRKRLHMPHTFVGKAVCAEGDEWNEELGRKIAYSRAKDKLYNSFYKRANLYVQSIDDTLTRMIEKLNHFGSSLEKDRDRLEESIDKMISKEE